MRSVNLKYVLGRRRGWQGGVDSVEWVNQGRSYVQRFVQESVPVLLNCCSKPSVPRQPSATCPTCTGALRAAATSELPHTRKAALIPGGSWFAILPGLPGSMKLEGRRSNRHVLQIGSDAVYCENPFSRNSIPRSMRPRSPFVHLSHCESMPVKELAAKIGRG